MVWRSLASYVDIQQDGLQCCGYGKNTKGSTLLKLVKMITITYQKLVWMYARRGIGISCIRSKKHSDVLSTSRSIG